MSDHMDNDEIPVSVKRPVKRRKTKMDRYTEDRHRRFVYGTDIIVLQSRGEAVAVVPAKKFLTIRGSTEDLEKVKGPDGIQVRQISFATDASNVMFLAHWIHHFDAEKAIDAVNINDTPWEMFFRVLKFVTTNQSTDIQDSLIDYFIDQTKKSIRNPEEILSVLYDILEAYAESECTNNHLQDVLAVLILYHDSCEISKLTEDYERDGLFPLCENIKARARIYLNNAWRARDWSKMPKDILADDFNDYCLYHSHGPTETCYREKSWH